MQLFANTWDESQSYPTSLSDPHQLSAEVAEHHEVGVVDAAAGNGDLLAIGREGIVSNSHRFAIEVSELRRLTAIKRLVEEVRACARSFGKNQSTTVRRPSRRMSRSDRREKDLISAIQLLHHNRILVLRSLKKS